MTAAGAGTTRAERPRWEELGPGAELTVVKLAPDGAEAARYPGRVVATFEEGRWVVVQAIWTYRRVDLAGLSFQPGDILLEWFSPDHPFNAFAVLSAAGDLRGWYGNVTLPAYLQPAADNGAPNLIWHDLYLDLVGLPNGDYTMLDADELVASSLAERDASLHARIIAAGQELERRFMTSRLPFLPVDQLARMGNFRAEHQ